VCVCVCVCVAWNLGAPALGRSLDFANPAYPTGTPLPRSCPRAARRTTRAPDVFAGRGIDLRRRKSRALSHERTNDAVIDTTHARSSSPIYARWEHHEPLTINPLLYINLLFTENSVATHKQYSTSINTNKIQNTTIESITSSFFTKLNYLFHLITKLAKGIYCRNVSYYKLILPFLRSIDCTERSV